MRKQIRVLLVDDHELARRGLRRMLELSDDIEVVSEAGNADEALGQVLELSPDVVIMDIQMGYINGLEATQLLKDRGFAGLSWCSPCMKSTWNRPSAWALRAI